MLRSLALLTARNRRLWMLLALLTITAGLALVACSSSSSSSSGGSTPAAATAARVKTASIGQAKGNGLNLSGGVWHEVLSPQ